MHTFKLILYIILIKIISCNYIASPYELGVIIQTYLSLSPTARGKTEIIDSTVKTAVESVSDNQKVDTLAENLVAYNPKLSRNGFYDIFNKNHATVDDLINDLNDFNSKNSFKFSSAFDPSKVFPQYKFMGMMDKIEKAIQEVEVYPLDNDNKLNYKIQMFNYVKVIADERFRDMVNIIQKTNCYVITKGKNPTKIKCIDAFDINTDKQEVTDKKNLNLNIVKNRYILGNNDDYAILRDGYTVDNSHLRLTNVANKVRRKLSTCNK